MTDLFSLASQMADLSNGRGLPPVDKWNPDYCGEIDMVIRHDGIWFHEGTPIGRPQLVKLFSTVLKKEQDEYFLVTPVEKMKITVEDVPFLAVDLEVEEPDGDNQRLVFKTYVGDTVTASAAHKIVFRRGKTEADELVPYVHIRAGLEARLSRPVYYQLAELAEGDPAFIKSCGAEFPFGT